MGRSVLQFIAALCLLVLVFTDLDLGQRLLLIGVTVPVAVIIWRDQLNGKA